MDVSREQMEELYLYLKEKVGDSQSQTTGKSGDLAQVVDEMHEHVYV